MIKGLIRLVFLVVVLIVLSQLEYKGRPLKEHVLELYHAPAVQLIIQWGRIEATKLLGLKEGLGTPAVRSQDLERISEEDQKGLDTLINKVNK